MNMSKESSNSSYSVYLIALNLWLIIKLILTQKNLDYIVEIKLFELPLVLYKSDSVFVTTLILYGFLCLFSDKKPINKVLSSAGFCLSVFLPYLLISSLFIKIF
jgi:hypothetical protein